MDTYFNFTQTAQTISYQPYQYDKSNTYAHFILGAIVLLAGTVLSLTQLWKDGIYFGILFGLILIINGLYRILFEAKITLEFNKTDDALCFYTPLGKKKKIALSNIYNIIVVSEQGSYTYDVTNKNKPSAKSIQITSFINKKRQQTPHFQFLENELIPQLLIFLELSPKIAI